MGKAAYAALALGGALVLAAGGARAAPLEQHLPVCAACHGKDGNSLIADNPSLAGMAPEYLVRQMKHFKSGDRKSAVMAPMAAALDADAMQALADHFSEQTPAAGKAGDPALAAKGKVVYDEGIVGSAVPACSGCHGDDGSGDAKYPRLAGQHAAYVEQQLAAYRSGARANDLKGVMGAVAKRMSDADMRAVAQYITGMNKE
ncbi:MAG: c-type cytochrome [Rubrivivax sp.]|nr:c-type cytochrome [Rubrivivax sp.]